jgi:hypothetical protein
MCGDASPDEETAARCAVTRWRIRATGEVLGALPACPLQYLERRRVRLSPVGARRCDGADAHGYRFGDRSAAGTCLAAGDEGASAVVPAGELEILVTAKSAGSEGEYVMIVAAR